MRYLTLALASAAVLVLPVAAQAQSNPLSSIFGCNNAGNRQGTGAVVGGVLGGVVGNQVANGDRTIETVLGAAIGAAAGSYIGCQMTGADTNQAQTATLTALNQNRSATWSNSRTGSSGRIDIVNSFDRSASYDRDRRVGGPGDYRGREEDRGRGYGADSLQRVRFAQGVQRPKDYVSLDERYTARGRVNIRSSPNSRARVVGQLRAGEAFDAVASVGNRQWLLASRNGTAVGYVSQSVVQFAGRNDQRRDDRNRGRDSQHQQSSMLCRTFDQTVQTRSNNRPVTERFTACKNDAGEWALET